MSALPPGDPQLVAMIVNHLKTQGLFDQFRRDCLADVDTKPAYLHLRQRVDNFVSNHLSNHTWSPQLNKNQLRNNIRQLVLQSGMLEQGVDRIVAQVVDPKIHHTFRPQVERIVRQFLSPGSHVEEEEPPLAPSLLVESQEVQLPSPAPSTGVDPADSASSQCQDEAGSRTQSAEPNQEEGEADMSLVEAEHMKEEEEEEGREAAHEVEEGRAAEQEEEQEEEKEEEGREAEQGDGKAACEEEVDREREMEVDREAEAAEVKAEEEEGEERNEAKEKSGRAAGRSKETEPPKSAGEKQHIRQRARERLKEEYSLEDSDLEGLSDITVSSVHTSDLSSLETESEDCQVPSDSTEEGEITSEDERAQQKSAGEEKRPRATRQGYVHKPFLYSRYYSDSDDEVTVEQRRRSAAKEKEERVLKRQQNRERLEEKRRQKAAQPEPHEKEKQSTAASSQEGPRPKAKEARKEKKVLEKKVALSRKRKRDSRKEDDSGSKRKSDADADMVKKDEALKLKAAPPKPSRKSSEAEEQRRRKSGSLSEDPCEPRRALDKSRTHSFILDLEMGSEEVLRQRGGGRGERPARRDGPARERERSISDEHPKPRPKPDCRKTGDGVAEGPAEDRGEKKGSKVKGERKGSAAKEGALKCGKKGKSEIPREKEKTTGKGEPKSLHRLDSTGSTEERSEVEAASEVNKKKEKPPKDVLKKSRSHTEVRTSEKVKSRQDSSSERTRPDPSTPEPPKHGSEGGSKVKPVSDKPRSKSRDDVKPQSPSGSRAEKKAAGHEAKARAASAPAPGRAEPIGEKKREDHVPEKARGAKAGKKTSDESAKEAEKERRSAPAEQLATPPAVAEAAQAAAETLPHPSELPASREESDVTEPDSLPDPDPAALLARDGETDLAHAGASDALAGPGFAACSPRPPTDSRLGPDLVAIATPGSPDTVAASDRIAADSSGAAVPDDMYDALSDITPEPEDEDDSAARLAESRERPRPLPAEADALLTLVDVCASAAGSDVTERSFREADMKMKEAALTLLSMDPDMSVSQSLITESQLLTDARGAAEETPVTRQRAEPQTLDSDDTKSAKEPSVAVTKESESDMVSGVQSEMEGGASQDDQHPHALMNTDIEDITADSTSLEEVMSETNRLEPESEPQSEIPAQDPSAHEEPAPEDTSANPEHSQTDTRPAAETQPENLAQGEQITAFHSETREPGAKREPATAENSRLGVSRVCGAGGGQKGDMGGVDATEPEAVQERQVQPARRGRPPKLIKQASSTSQSDGREEEQAEMSEMEDRAEGRTTRRGRPPNQKAAPAKDGGSVDKEEPENTAPRKNEDEEADEGGLNKSSNPNPDTPQSDACLTLQDQEMEAAEQEVEHREVRRGRRRSGAQSSTAAKPALKRKRSDQAEHSGKELPAQEEDTMKRAEDDSEVTDEAWQETRGERGESESLKDSIEEMEEEEKDEPVRKTPRRGRPSKSTSGTDESVLEKKEGGAETGEDDEKQEEEETKTRATTRAASRLEAEKNKPSKPSTRAFSRLGGKEEISPNTRASRGQVSGAVKGRKREVSPPTSRTRAGHRAEEPPSKRTKR